MVHDDYLIHAMALFSSTQVDLPAPPFFALLMPSPLTCRLVRCLYVGVRAAGQQATAIRLDAIRREISSGGLIAPVGTLYL
eukprot:m.50611 g.50611  ORF g.50611 m.50611 type:complete len:81 (-) comp7251_c0_seq2:207-449(-)